nr:serine/threonine/dual specificity protein kinase, catalytic domain-containing protein [Tanacetum cinerariifolium]
EDDGEQRNSSQLSSVDRRYVHKEDHCDRICSSLLSLHDKCCRVFSLVEIKLITHDFDDALVIGKGGFGKVYKGYCEDSSTREMILVYEYMPNESFHHHSHKRKANGRNSSPLTWVQRPNICIGLDRSLDYLYTGTGVESTVTHHDVKSSNVLLDEKLAAKILDLGCPDLVLPIS